MFNVYSHQRVSEADKLPYGLFGEEPGRYNEAVYILLVQELRILSYKPLLSYRICLVGEAFFGHRPTRTFRSTS